MLDVGCNREGSKHEVDLKDRAELKQLGVCELPKVWDRGLVSPGMTVSCFFLVTAIRLGLGCKIVFRGKQVSRCAVRTPAS